MYDRKNQCVCVRFECKQRNVTENFLFLQLVVEQQGNDSLLLYLHSEVLYVCCACAYALTSFLLLLFNVFCLLAVVLSHFLCVFNNSLYHKALLYMHTHLFHVYYFFYGLRSFSMIIRRLKLSLVVCILYVFSWFKNTNTTRSGKDFVCWVQQRFYHS